MSPKFPLGSWPRIWDLLNFSALVFLNSQNCYHTGGKKVDPTGYVLSREIYGRNVRFLDETLQK